MLEIVLCVDYENIEFDISNIANPSFQIMHFAEQAGSR